MNRPVTSASNLFRRALCPGSERMEYALPEDDSEQSREGQLLHDYAAHPEYDRTVLRPEQRDLLDRNDTLIRVIEGRIEDQTRVLATGYNRELFLNNGLISGTVDLLIHFQEQAKAIGVNDSKFGYKVVERAELNLQLRAYAVLVYDFTADSKPESVYVSITQPRLSYEERITLAEYKPSDIEAAREEIAEILRRASKDNAKLIAGEEQCRYCKAKLVCPAFQQTLTVPVLALRPQQDLSKTAREAYLEQKLSECSDEQLEKVLVACAFAGMIRDPAKDEARKRIARGELDNYTLSKAFNERQIVDPQKAIALLNLGKVATRDDILSICSLPLKQLEDSYRKKTGCTWKEAREKIDTVLASVIENTEHKPRVLKK